MRMCSEKLSSNNNNNNGIKCMKIRNTYTHTKVIELAEVNLKSVW